MYSCFFLFDIGETVAVWCHRMGNFEHFSMRHIYVEGLNPSEAFLELQERNFVSCQNNLPHIDVVDTLGSARR